jgi:hypothetical protein
MESIKAMIETITTTEAETPSFRLSLRDRLSSNQELDPEYFGDEIANEAAASQGWTIWDLAGKLREIWNATTHPRVKEVLEKNKNELCKKARNLPVAGLHGWITGRSKPTACPTIVIICRDKHYRKVAKKLIQDRDMIDLLVEDKISFKVMTLPCFINRPAGSWDDRKVYSPVRMIGGSIVGLPIAVSSSDGMQTSQARVGGLVLVDGEPHGMTVAHVFEEGFGDDSLSEISDSDSNEEEDDEWGWNISNLSTKSGRSQSSNVTGKLLQRCSFFINISITHNQKRPTRT